jgi:putative DNA-invertase from lambdoid prophage Rac
MRVAIYARVSTDDQNCEMQLRELREYCQRRKWHIEDEYVDAGWSGAKSSRPQLNKLKQAARERRFDVVVVWKLDRWGRSVADNIAGIQELIANDVRFIAVTQNIDTDESNPMSRFLLHIMAAFAELEREMIRERVRAGVKQHRENIRQGRIGRDIHTKSGKDLPTGRPRKVFRRDLARELWAAGKSLRAISAELDVSLSVISRELKGVPKPCFQGPVVVAQTNGRIRPV